MFSQRIEHSGSVILLPQTPLFSFDTFHLNLNKIVMLMCDRSAEVKICVSGVRFTKVFMT